MFFFENMLFLRDGSARGWLSLLGQQLGGGFQHLGGHGCGEGAHHDIQWKNLKSVGSVPAPNLSCTTLQTPSRKSTVQIVLHICLARGDYVIGQQAGKRLVETPRNTAYVPSTGTIRANAQISFVSNLKATTTSRQLQHR